MSDTFFEPDVQKRFSKLMFANQENGVFHNPYDEEQREFTAVEQGNIEQLRKSIEENYEGKIGILARDPLRSAKNLAIVVITLASRAAMRGGLEPETAYSLSDSYIQKAEDLHTVDSLEDLMRHAEYQYTQMVHELCERRKERPENSERVHKNPKTDECRSYIVTHLHDKLTVEGIADKLKMNANYLSQLFIKEEQISVPDFILQERIRVAKDLLLYSEYSCGDIAEYLCFSSQSHFGQRFRELTGMTPKTYRNKYGKRKSR
jgi:YesN/AraC family two-component response regulator